jgi:8-oxo-dGTP diphosphatase
MSSNCQYKNPALTTDAIVLRKSATNSGKFDILLIKRKNNPFKGCFAFPGGFVDYGEDPEHAVLRELKEETGLTGEAPVYLIAVQGDPNRDPRQHVVTVAYAVKVKEQNLGDLKAGDDASDATFCSLDQVLSNEKGEYKLAFDHREILNKYISWFEDKGKSLLFK